MLNITRLPQGDAYKRYLTDGTPKEVKEVEGSALTRYYAASVTPPGPWLGGGVAGLGLEKGGLVTDEHLAHMLEELAHPVTGEPVGGTPPRPKDQAVKPGRNGKKRAKQATAVAGFDFTFTMPKSVSTAWGLADEGTQALIYECHQRAIEDTLAYAEEYYLRSRSGKSGVAQEEIEGVVAASFTHWDSRDHDPRLHDHVVVWNRAKSASDGKWRTLDSRGLYKANQAISTLHANILATYLTNALGWGWEHQETHRGMAKCEVAGVPEKLTAEFSQRRKAVIARHDELVANFKETYGREPTAGQLDELSDDASKQTRGQKVRKSLQDLTGDWRDRAEPYVGTEPVSWVSTLADRNDLPRLRAGDLSDEMLAEVARIARRRTSERRPVYSRAHVETQVSIELFGVNFASPGDVIAVTRKATDMALADSLQVSVNDLHHVPARWKSRDGASKFRPVAAPAFHHRGPSPGRGPPVHPGRAPRP